MLFKIMSTLRRPFSRRVRSRMNNPNRGRAEEMRRAIVSSMRNSEPLACRAVNASGRSSSGDFRVLFVTNHPGDEKDRDRPNQSGRSGALVKPLQPDLLLERVARVLVESSD